MRVNVLRGRERLRMLRLHRVHSLKEREENFGPVKDLYELFMDTIKTRIVFKESNDKWNSCKLDFNRFIFLFYLLTLTLLTKREYQNGQLR